MEGSDFYLYLPSDSSALYFPDNTPSHFATQLNRRIILSGQYECALTQIQYLHAWNTFEENSCTISFNLQQRVTIPNDANLKHFESISEFIKYFNSLQIPFLRVIYLSREDKFIIHWWGKKPVKLGGNFIVAMGFGTVTNFKFGETISTKNVDHSYFVDLQSRKRHNDSFNINFEENVEFNDKPVKLEIGHYDTIDILVNELNNLSLNIDREQLLVEFKFEKTRNKVHVRINPFFKITLSEELGRLLGFETLTITETMYAPRFPKIADNIYTFYIYSDIVSSCLVGDTEAPLLEAFQPSGKGGEVVTERFPIRNYKPVSKNTFESILIQIRDQRGTLIPFRGGYVLLTLHFRPRHNR